jgi:secondary thiamine-phosphate synthase enzyme
METKLISFQKEIVLPSYSKGFHLITNRILEEIPELNTVSIGTLHIFIKHTSASLSINENADPSVRTDFENFFQKLAPEMEPYYTHTSEGPDDMPAHLKASLLGSSITIPITNGKLNLGIWQGVYLGEHRDYGGKRKLVVTILGSSR